MSSSLVAGMGFAALLYGASPASAQSAPPLGRVQSFAVLGGSAVTAAGPAGTVIGGDVGSAPTPSVSGFPPAVVTAGFTVYTAANAVTAGARTDAGTAYTNLAGQTCPAANIIAGGNLGGLGLGPGVYCMPTGNLTGTLTLTGSATDVWVFQMTLDTLTTASSSQVVMGGAANPCNVFWQVSSSATLGSGSTLSGNIFAGVSITLGTTSHVMGRAIAGTGAVTLDGGNHVDTCSAAGPGGLATTTLSTVASPGVTLGAPVHDTATLSGGGIGSAAPTGTITFSLYGPNDPICDTTAIFTSPVTVNGTGTYNSGSFSPSVIGTYRWRAGYSGDANNAAFLTACADVSESVIVSAAAIPAAAGIPTLSGWGLMSLMVLIGIASIYRLRNF